MELIQHEIKVIEIYNQLTKSVKETNIFKKARSKRAIELNLLRKLKNKVKRGLK
tara:strand:- start:959 stop:1120 length:162 start_codon:yes stop_codon:yes gene_type:complete